MYASDATLLTLSNQVAKLREALTTKHPGIGNLLAEIKSALDKHPENVTLLKEEEFATIFDAIKVETGIQFAAETVKGSKSASSASMKALKDKINKMGKDAF